MRGGDFQLFSVVAEKIKQFASQNTKSAENIAQLIDDVHNKMQSAVSVIDKISTIIEKINQSYLNVARTIEKQIQTSGDLTLKINEINVNTNNIAGAIVQAAVGVNEISKNSGNSAIASNDFSNIISTITEASKHSDQCAKNVQTAASDLDKISKSLNIIVNKFVV